MATATKVRRLEPGKRNAVVDSVEDVMEVNGEVRPVRTSLKGGWRRVARGMIEVGPDLLLLVDTQSLLAGPTAQAA